MTKISLILPCYNVEKYIGRCLNSIYSQDLDEDEYEVICVDDCSSDRTNALIQDYQKIHRNLLLLHHHTNRKQGAARNTGLIVASGKYVWFIDSDDYIKQNIFQDILSLMEVDNLEILQFDGHQENNSNNIGNHLTSESKVTPGIEVFKKDKNFWDIQYVPWNKVYKSDFLLDNNLFFPEVLYGEDTIHTIMVLISAKKVKCISDSFYFYCRTPDSTINSPINATKVFCYTLLNGNQILDLSRKIDDPYKRYFSEGGITRINQFTKPFLKLSFKEKLLFYKNAKINKSLISDVWEKLIIVNKLIIKLPILFLFINPVIQLGINLKTYIRNHKFQVFQFL